MIRPFLLKPEDAKGLDTVPSKTDPSRRFLIAVSAEDCVDCGSCAEMCPARVKALTMEKAEDRMHQDQMVFHYAKARGVQKGSDGSVRESQFLRPYLEYSGACPGCGETPYAKLVTQLFGDRAVIANATGCSSIWGASVPSMPYVVDETGKGPAWANSLFEDNAEFGYGMAISLRTRRAALKIVVERMAKNPAFAGIAKAWLAQMDTPEAGHLGQSLAALCKVYPEDADAKYVLEHADLLPSPSLWIFGGDGWAYDIGYGGLDHILASRENFNVLVFDTEVYSNTGGQSSKATPTGAVAQFAAGGKPTDKKDLAQIAMTNGHVYVAQVAIGANPRPDPQSPAGGRELRRPLPHHRLRPLHQPRAEGGDEPVHGGDEEGRPGRVLEPAAVRPPPGGGREEPPADRQRQAQRGLPGLPAGRGALCLSDHEESGPCQGVVRGLGAQCRSSL